MKMIYAQRQIYDSFGEMPSDQCRRGRGPLCNLILAKAHSLRAQIRYPVASRLNIFRSNSAQSLAPILVGVARVRRA
jgi:hypothetical protein